MLIYFVIISMSKSIINIYIPKNNTIFISIISIFLAFIVLLYFKPSFFVFIFHTILGNLLLLGILSIIWFLDKKLSIGLGFLLLIIYLSSKINSLSNMGMKLKEGFDNNSESKFNPWSDQLIEDFKEFQQSRNPNIEYDINLLQKQATEDEVKELFKTGKWPWSEDIKEMYKLAIAGSYNISMDPGISLNNAESIYNENAMKQLLSWSSKEGNFLLNGVIIGHPEGMPDNINNLARCGISKDGSGTSVMQKIEYLGYDGINSHMIKNVTDIANTDIPKVVNGFVFMNGDCNPCLPLNDPSDYSCPFKLNVGNGTEITDIWKNLWNLNEASVSEENKVKKNEFPLLTGLRSELNKVYSYNSGLEEQNNNKEKDKEEKKYGKNKDQNSEKYLDGPILDNSEEIGGESWVPGLEGGRM